MEPDMESLFNTGWNGKSSYAPLAERMRPVSLEEICGQEAAVGKGSFLRAMIEKDSVPSLLLFGPPGCGKTTIADVIAKVTRSVFIKLNATSSGAAEIRKVIAEAKEQQQYYGCRTIVFIDEIHRFNKGQQDLLLPYVEDGTIVLIGATTENPFFEVNAPLRSRLRLIRLIPLSEEDILRILEHALTDEDRGLGKLRYTADRHLLKEIASCAGGDSRVALNLLEQAVSMLPAGGTLTEKQIERITGERSIAYDKSGDNHYDIASAFIKSMRGSDPDAAIHYLARMIAGGEDPSFISRRIMICAAEDVGLADPEALSVAVAAAQAAEMVGFPEARIPLAEAVLYICLAEKSNSSIMAIDRAAEDVRRGDIGSVPMHLRDAHYKGASALGHGTEYKYPHSYGGWVDQQYLPDSLKDKKYYTPVCRGMENGLAEMWTKRRKKK